MSGRITTALARDEHTEAIAAFYREVWDPLATVESVFAARKDGAATNVAYPGEAPPTAIVFKGKRVVGYCSTIAQLIWNGESERPGYWVKGLMVVPEFRSGPLGFLVMKELARHLELSTILTVAPAARRLFSALGYIDMGSIPNWVRPLRPGRMLRHLRLGGLGVRVAPAWATATINAAQRTGVATALGGGAGSLFRLGARIYRFGTGHIATTINTIAPSQSEIDTLWGDARDKISSSPVRNGEYLRKRYDSGTNRGKYQFISAREGTSLIGLAVMRRPGTTSDPRLGAVRVATVADILFRPDRASVAMALLGGIERAARAADADAILATSAHPRLVAHLTKQAYLRVSANVHFFLRDRTAALNWPKSLQGWWLSRGDGQSDESF